MTGPSKPRESSETERIDLTFPANVDLVVLARFTAATVASRAGFDVNDIEDLRLAVDELCVALGPLQPETSVHLVFERADDTVKIAATFTPLPRGDEAADPGEALWAQGRELSRRLLDSLVDEHGYEIGDDHRCTWLRKRRSPARR